MQAATKKKKIKMQKETKVDNAQQIYDKQVSDLTSKQVLDCWSLRDFPVLWERRDLLFLLVCDSYASHFVIAFRKSNRSFGTSSCKSQ